MYKVRIDKFEGPFDLLIYLLENARMDIYDIKVAEITEQYIGYLKEMEELNVEVDTEFIVLAAVLIRLKSRMLLPRINEAGEIEIVEDPRIELRGRLLDYMRIKKAAELLKGNDAFAPTAVFAYMDEHIGKRSQMKASELNISSIDELIFAMLIPSYCGSADSHYQISAPLYEKFHCLGYAIEDYLIIRKKEKAL